MTIKRITTIVPVQMLKPLERHLRSCGVPGVTVEHVQGYGEHPNYFRRDLLQDNARLVLYAGAEEIDHVVAAITACATEVGAQAGILVVESIERLISLPTGADITAPLTAN